MSWALIGAAGLAAAATGTQAGLQFAAAKEAGEPPGSDELFFSLPQGLESFPLAALLGQDIATALGRGAGGIAQQASPFNQARQQIQENPGLSQKDKRRALVGLDFLEQSGVEHNDPIPARAARQALRATDFGSPQGLLQAVADFRQEQQRFQEQLGQTDVLDRALRGRLENEALIGDLLADLPQASASEISELENEARAVLDERFNEQRAAILERANAQRINPAGILGELEQARANETRTAPLERALTLLQGRLGLAGTELTTRLAGRSQPQQAGTALLALQGQSAASAGQIAAQQALARTQQGQENRLAALGLQGQAGQTIGSGLGDIATIALLPSLIGGPASGGGTGNAGNQSNADLLNVLLGGARA